MNAKKLAGSMFNYDVYAIDGEFIRNEIEVDFVEGGNHGRYPGFIPEDEIWIEEFLSPLDFAATAIHEFVEVTLMRRGGMGYEAAHDYANVAEQQFRREYEWRAGIDLETAEDWLKLFLSVDSF
jgi:hypothetical protein